MTNVPDNIREMWKDLYILFDTHFLMDISSESAWTEFWDKARQLLEKHNSIPSVIELIDASADMIVKLAKGREKT